MMRTIKDKLLEINQDETWNSDKVDKTETFIKEFAIVFLEWSNENYDYYHGDGEYHSAIENKWYKTKELLEIYIKTL